MAPENHLCYLMHLVSPLNLSLFPGSGHALISFDLVKVYSLPLVCTLGLLQLYPKAAHMSFLNPKSDLPSETEQDLWGSWAWEPFEQLLIREGRGGRDKGGAAKKQ